MFGYVHKSELIAKDKEIVRIKAQHCAVEMDLLGEIQELKAVYGYQMQEKEIEIECLNAVCVATVNRLHASQAKLKKCQDSKAGLRKDLYASKPGNDKPLSSECPLELCTETPCFNPRPQKGKPKKDKI